MFLTTKKSVQARLVGNTLVAVFRNSTPSLIWKFDLERNHSFTLALQGEDGDLELGVTSSKGEFYPVARFSTREDADEAFTAVQKILMRRKFIRFKSFFTGVIGTIILLLIVIAFGRYVLHSFDDISLPSLRSSAPQAIPPSAPKPAPNGVPVPADQVLSPPQ